MRRSKLVQAKRLPDKKCAKSGNVGHLAKCCQPARKRNHITEETYNAGDKWTLDIKHNTTEDPFNWNRQQERTAVLHYHCICHSYSKVKI